MQFPCSRCFALAAVAGLFAPLVSAGPVDAPFEATISFSEQVAVIGAPGTVPCALHGVISGAGTATMTGAVALASTDCVNPLSETTLSFASLSAVVLTSANGDEIRARYAGIFSAGVLIGGYWIEGGTGRFANASGSGTLEGVEAVDWSALTGIGYFRLRGTISY